MFCFAGRKHIVSPRGRKHAAHADKSRTDGQADGRETDVGRRNIGKIYPLYEDYMQKLAECRVPKKEKGSQAAQSDKDIDENIKARFSAQEKRLDVQKSYYDKFKKVLTMRQVQQLYERPDMGSRPRFQGQKPHSAPRR